MEGRGVGGGTGRDREGGSKERVAQRCSIPPTLPF